MGKGCRGGLRRTIRGRIGVIAGALAVIAATCGLVLERVRFERDEAVAEVVQKNEALTLAYEQQVLRTLQVIDQAIRFVRHEYLVGGKGFAVREALESGWLDPQLFLYAAIIDGNGRVILSSTSSAVVDVSDREYYRYHRDSGVDELWIGAPTVGRLSGKLSIHLTRPIQGPDGSFIGVAMVAVAPEFLAEGHRYLDIGEQGLVVFAGVDGIARVRRAGQQTVFGADMRGSTLHRAAQQDRSGNFVSVGRIEGVPRFVSYRRLQDYPFVASVGVSVDGPDELNDSRWAGTVERTREATAKSLKAIEMLTAAHLSISVITTLYRGNASGDRLPRLIAWLDQLVSAPLHVRYLNLHLLEVDDLSARALRLTADEQLTALRAIRAFVERHAGKQLYVHPFRDMRLLLLGQDETIERDAAGHVTRRKGESNCIWNGCDAYTTASVRGVDAHGGRSNCGRTNKEGVAWFKGDRAGYERQIALYHTPQAHGGCQGCRFFLACKGNCPGTAIDGDWRNRSEHCAVWYGLLEDEERRIALRGAMPLSLSPFRPELEAALVDAWRHGRNVSLRRLVEWFATPAAERAPLFEKPGDRPHGDIPHGDEHGDIDHGDHTDVHHATIRRENEEVSALQIDKNDR